MGEEFEIREKKFNTGDIVIVLNKDMPTDYRKYIGMVGEVIGYETSDWIEVRFYEATPIQGKPLFLESELDYFDCVELEPLDDVSMLLSQVD